MGSVSSASSSLSEAVTQHGDTEADADRALVGHSLSCLFISQEQTQPCWSPSCQTDPICGGCSPRSRRVSWAWWPPKLLPPFPVNSSGIRSCSLVLFTGRVKFEKGIPIFIHSFSPRILKHQPQNTGQLPIGCKSGLLWSKLGNGIGRGGDLRGLTAVFTSPLKENFLISNKDLMQENLEEIRLHKCLGFFSPGAAISCITAGCFIPLFSLSMELQK